MSGETTSNDAGTRSGSASDSASGAEFATAREHLDEARARLRDVPAHVVVANHVMGLYELAAIHLSAEPVDLDSARVAIDAVALLVDGLGDRLGPDHATMAEALSTLQLAYVRLQSLRS